jgi:hypothetical protein
MEIMGLAVIVILLAVGMFFVAKFSLLKERPSEVQSFQQSQIASTFVSTLLSTNAGCASSTATFTKLIEDLVQPQYSLLQCGSGELQPYFEDSVRQILSETLDVWGYAYQFAVIFPPGATDAENIVIEKDCQTTQQEETKTYYVPSDLGTIRVQMKLCY